MTSKTARLVLSDGQSFEGRLIGSPCRASGELVFTTGMVGYSESLTDPSYFGQILVFTYPLIGNYGIPSLPKDSGQDGQMLPRGFESYRVNASGLIIATDSADTYHWNSDQNLDLWLKDQNVPGIAGLDTRSLVHIIRENRGILGRIEVDGSDARRSYSNSVNLDVSKHEFFNPGEHLILPEISTQKVRTFGKGKVRIGLIDCGVKWNIIRQLVSQDVEVMLLPWDTDLKSVDCAGWVISNGPGDPEQTGDLRMRIRELLNEERPILGICLGHQLLCLAADAKSKKMAYGHRSHNQPVYLCGTRRGFITSQNHGYVIDDSTIGPDWEVWFRNANDQTVEGLKHKTKPFRSVQFHPEAAGGPRDTGWIIDEFVAEVNARCRS